MAGGDIDAQLAALADLSLEDLQARWSEVTGAPLPQVSAALLRLALAYELQSACYGGLARHTEQRLKALASGSGDSAVLKPGARLVREWNGVLHTVVIGEDGAISWNGKDWNSLSQVARAITGTRWSGPAFFGLKPRRKAA
jgi:hypothetical protein